MAASSPSLSAFTLCVLAAFGCAKGSGEGQVSGTVWAPDCGLEGDLFELNPNFFAMQPSFSVEVIDIVVQRGSDQRTFSDYLSVFIREPEELRDSMLGTEIELGGFEAPVEMTLSLNATCPGIARLPVAYAAVSGTIRFERLFVPWLADNDTDETTAVFRDVVLVDRQEPDERRAQIDGDFTFLFERGLPPQFF